MSSITLFAFSGNSLFDFALFTIYGAILLGESPNLFCSLSDAPRDTNNFTSARCSLLTILLGALEIWSNKTCKGVLPLAFFLLISVPVSSTLFTISREPLITALCKDELPCISVLYNPSTAYLVQI